MHGASFRLSLCTGALYSDDEMDTQSKRVLRKNLEFLIAQSGMSLDVYARTKKVPRKLLDGILAHDDVESHVAINLELLCDRLGISADQLLSPDLSFGFKGSSSGSARDLRPATGNPDRLLARQLGRLIEDFVECNEAGRFEVTALAQELAEEELRRTGRPLKVPGPPA